MSRIPAAILLSALFVSSASAQLSVYGERCTNNVWNTLTESQIVEQKLQERVALFSGGVEAAKKHDRQPRALNVMVTDCPVNGFAIRVLKNHNGMRLGQGMGVPPTYTIYLTATYIRNTEPDILKHEAWRHTCRVIAGDVGDYSQTQTDTRDAKRCLADVAKASGDGEYALWLERQLGEAGQSLAQRDARRSIQQHIDNLKARPGPVPADAIKKLEELRDSFK